ncbi:MAG: M20 family metallopeptidase [Methylocystis sp.]|nr:M20 family metallopeptidase [Methylocystis sp.]
MTNARFDSETIASVLEGWVARESPTMEAAAVNRMQDLVQAFFAAGNCHVERFAGRNGLGDTLKVTAGPANGKPPILVLSHVDTVHPLRTIERDLPFRRDGDRLYGPGIYDMKGGACLASEAFRNVAAKGSATRPLVFLFTPDEEIGSPTTRDLIEAEGRRAGYVLVTEPARDGGRIVTARKGVGRFDVHVEGRPAHSGSRHQDGRSAIREAARQILAIEGLTDYERGVTTTIGRIQGGTAANVIPQHCRFEVDLRVTNVSDGEHFERHILGLRPFDPDVALRITGAMNRPPMAKTPAIQALYDHAVDCARACGFELPEAPMTGGGSDGNFTAALGIPTLDGLGCDGDGAHTLHEHCFVSSLAPRAALLARLLETL